MLLDKFLKRSSKSPKPENFFVFIESPIKVVGSQISLWGQSNWWPLECGIRTVNVPDGNLDLGTKTKTKIKGVLPGTLQSQVSALVPDRLIERTFTGGLLKGKETISVEERYNGTRLDVRLEASPSNIINQLLWPLFYRKTYIQGMKKVLENIKNYCLSVQRL